jgi:hypothetical protein
MHEAVFRTRLRRYSRYLQQGRGRKMKAQSLRQSWRMFSENVAVPLLCLVLGMIYGALIGGWVSPPVVGEPWMKTYQGVASAALGITAALVGIAVATFNVLRQMRVNLMSREEDRIEEALPGMLQMLALIDRLHLVLRDPANDPHGSIAVLEKQSLLTHNVAEMRDAIEKYIPDLDPVRRVELARHLSSLVNGIQELAAHEKLLKHERQIAGGGGPRSEQYRVSAEHRTEHITAVREAVEKHTKAMDALRVRTNDACERYTKRLTSIRAAIEDHFQRVAI